MDNLLLIIKYTTDTELVWNTAQRAILIAPSRTYYSFLLWFNIETNGSAASGYITNPDAYTAHAYFPNVTVVLNVTGSALYIKS